MGTEELSPGLAWLRVLSPPQPLPVLAVEHQLHWAPILPSSAGRTGRGTPSWMGLHTPESAPSGQRSGAHHLEEGRLRLEAVGLLVPQHQIVSRIDDDLLQAHKGAQEPGGTGGRRGPWRTPPQTDCSPSPQEEPSADLPTDCPAGRFFRTVGKDVDPAGSPHLMP